MEIPLNEIDKALQRDAEHGPILMKQAEGLLPPKLCPLCNGAVSQDCGHHATIRGDIMPLPAAGPCPSEAQINGGRWLLHSNVDLPNVKIGDSMAQRDYIIGRDELLRLIQRLANSWDDTEEHSLLSNAEYLTFINDLAQLLTRYCGGSTGQLTLHRRKLGTIAIKLTLDDQDPKYALWLEHIREH